MQVGLQPGALTDGWHTTFVEITSRHGYVIKTVKKLKVESQGLWGVVQNVAHHRVDAEVQVRQLDEGRPEAVARRRRHPRQQRTLHMGRPHLQPQRNPAAHQETRVS